MSEISECKIKHYLCNKQIKKIINDYRGLTAGEAAKACRQFSGTDTKPGQPFCGTDTNH